MKGIEGTRAISRNGEVRRYGYRRERLRMIPLSTWLAKDDGVPGWRLPYLRL